MTLKEQIKALRLEVAEEALSRTHAENEADSAWEAHRQLNLAHVELKSRYEELARIRRRDYPLLSAFEEIASMAGKGPDLPGDRAVMMLRRIREVIDKARDQSRGIAQRQVAS